MSGGSDASMLGYGKIAPLSGINPNNANVTNSHNPAIFTSKMIPGFPGLRGASNNVAAASGKWMGGGAKLQGDFNFKVGIDFKGNSKMIKKKIKNITKQYKGMGMGMGMKKKSKTLKKRSRARMQKSKHMQKTRRHKKKQMRQKGGYSQYQNNLPLTPSYSLGGNLSAANLGLANPPPYSLLKSCVNCEDNYNHVTGMGSPSRGH